MSEQPRPKILVGIPGFAGIQPEAQRSIVAMMFRCGRDLRDFDIAIEIVTKKEQFRARNALVDRAIGGGFDWLLMLDDDMIVPPDLLQRLLAHDKDVTGALYYQRGGAYHPVIMKRVSRDSDEWNIHFLNMYDPIITEPGLHEVDIIGGGCMLFKTDVFTKLTPPYFWWEARLGTDIAICTRLQEAGFPIHVDTSMELAHLGDKPLISSRTLPRSVRELGIVREQLWDDAKEYLCMSDEELLSKMDQAVGGTSHRERWQLQDRTTWEGVRDYYTSYGDWHILNLLYYVYYKLDRFTEWCLLYAPNELPTDATILDLGPGVGDKAFPLALNHGYRVYCADIDGAKTLDFLEWRAAKHKLLAMPSRTQALIPWRFSTAVPDRDVPMQVDCVLMISMLEHLSDPFGTLEWVARQIKPGGILVCDYHCVPHEDEPQHLVGYDPATFGLWMREHGWTESVEYSWLFTKT